MLPLIRALFAEVNPIPVKAALNMMGYIHREYRMPLCDPSNETLYRLYDEMVKFGIKNQIENIQNKTERIHRKSKTSPQNKSRFSPKKEHRRQWHIKIHFRKALLFSDYHLI